jgi:hypothetical protein
VYRNDLVSFEQSGELPSSFRYGSAYRGEEVTVAISELLDVEVPFTLSSVIVDWTVFRLAASLSISQVFLGSFEWLAR